MVNNFMNRKYKPFEGNWRKKPVLTASVEKIQEIGNRQYKQAMLHMTRFLKYETSCKQPQQQEDPQCTFRPKIYTQSYRNKNDKLQAKSSANLPERRLIEWGQKRDRKKILKAVNNSIEVVRKVDINHILSSSLQRIKPTYSDKHFLTKNLSTKTTNTTMTTKSPTFTANKTSYFSKKSSMTNMTSAPGVTSMLSLMMG